MGTELFHADGRMDMTKIVVAFRNFAKAPKNESKKHSETVWIRCEFLNFKVVYSVQFVIVYIY